MKKTAKPKTKPKAKSRKPAVRSCRLDIRLTPAEKAKLQARATKTKLTITNVILEMIGKL